MSAYSSPMGPGFLIFFNAFDQFGGEPGEYDQAFDEIKEVVSEEIYEKTIPQVKELAREEVKKTTWEDLQRVLREEFIDDEAEVPKDEAEQIYLQIQIIRLYCLMRRDEEMLLLILAMSV